MTLAERHALLADRLRRIKAMVPDSPGIDAAIDWHEAIVAALEDEA